MNAFFDSLKSDLLDRRLTPVLALLGAGLLAAIVYAVIGGGSSSPAPAASTPVAVPKTSGIAVSAVTTPKTSVAETTSGSAEQTAGGATRNPFKPLAGAVSATTTATSASASGSSAGSSTASGAESGSGSGATGSQGSGSETNSSQGAATQPQEKKSSKPGKAYKVSVLFGTAPAGTPVLSAGLSSYENLKRQQPLPSSTQPLIVFRGVIAGGQSATFTLVGEAILRGDAACLPSASQCQAIDLKVGDTEELEYVPLGGTAVTYELHVVKIEAIKAKTDNAGKAAKAAKVATADTAGGESKAGLKLLRDSGLMALPGLRYSRDGSVLVFLGTGHASHARAHVSAWGAALKG